MPTPSRNFTAQGEVFMWKEKSGTPVSGRQHCWASARQVRILGYRLTNRLTSPLRKGLNPLDSKGNYSATSNIRIIRSWYTGRLRVGSNIWYSKERPGQAVALPLGRLWLCPVPTSLYQL